MRTLPALLALLLLAPLASCSSEDNSGASRPTVVAAVYPLQWLAQEVVGDSAQVVGLVKPGVEPHDVELSPRQVAELREARVVLYLKGFQPAVDKAVEGLKNAFDLTETVHLVDREGGPDPHVWLDPVLMKALATQVSSILEETVSGKDAYVTGFQVAARRVGDALTSLDTTFRTALTGCRSKDLVTSHEAFGYLASRYGLTQRGISGLSPDAEPSPKRLAEVAAFARTHGVRTIFFESLVSPKVAETVAAEVGAKTAVLDPLESVTGDDDYLTVMRRNAATLHEALGCT